MAEPNAAPAEPSLVTSIIHVVEAGHRVVLDRLDLVRYDLAETGTRTLRGAALIGVGAVLLAGSWFALMAGAVIWLQTFMSLAISTAIVGGASALVGAIALALGIGLARRAVEQLGSEIGSDLGAARPAATTEIVATEGAARL
jgi:hypothetical protein